MTDNNSRGLLQDKDSKDVPGHIRLIDAQQITEVVAELCVESNIIINEDILAALSGAKTRESDPIAKDVLETLIMNTEAAKRERLPICQDTGMAVVFVSIGSGVHIIGDIDSAINNGVRRGYREGYCRSSVVRDPIDRINTGDNTPAVIYYSFSPGDKIKITVAPKGFGSENMSGVCMLSPSDGVDGVMEFVVSVIRSAGPNPCPPVIVGVGIGGTMDKAALMSKEALLRDVGSTHPNAFWASIETQLLDRINDLGIGPGGFGGRTTALGVHIMTNPTHIAGLPVAVNIGCHATRHKTAFI